MRSNARLMAAQSLLAAAGGAELRILNVRSRGDASCPSQMEPIGPAHPSNQTNSRKMTRRPQGVARAAGSTLLALLQNERSTIERTISSGYMRGVGTEAEDVKCTDANSSMWQPTRRRASYLSGPTLFVEVACTTGSRNPPNPTKLVPRKRHLPCTGTSFWSLR